MSCKLCTGKTSTLQNESYTCNYCGKPTISEPRMRAEVSVSDSTGFVFASLSEVDAELYLGSTVDHLQESLLQDNQQKIEDLLKPNTTTEYYVQLSVYSSDYLGVSTRKYNALFIDAPEENIEPKTSTESSCTITHAPQAQLCGVGPDDPDLTPEEKEMFQKILARKLTQQQQSSLILTSAPLSLEVETYPTSSQPDKLHAISPQLTGLAAANLQIDALDATNPQLDAPINAITEGFTNEEVHADGQTIDLQADENWLELMKGLAEKSDVADNVKGSGLTNKKYRTSNRSTKRKLDMSACDED